MAPNAPVSASRGAHEAAPPTPPRTLLRYLTACTSPPADSTLTVPNAPASTSDMLLLLEVLARSCLAIPPSQLRRHPQHGCSDLLSAHAPDTLCMVFDPHCLTAGSRAYACVCRLSEAISVCCQGRVQGRV